MSGISQPHVEQGVIDHFEEQLRVAAEEHNTEILSLSLGGQDRTLGADNMFAAQERYLLVEFKWSLSSLSTEADKPLRVKMCKRLRNTENPKKYAKALQKQKNCHFIAWGANDPMMAASLEVMINNYLDEICNRDVLSKTKEMSHHPANLSSRRSSFQFSGDLMRVKDPVDGVEFKFFSAYVAWLSNLANRDGSEGWTLLIRDTVYEGGRRRIVTHRFDSFEKMHNWVVSSGRTKFRPLPEKDTGISRRGGPENGM